MHKKELVRVVSKVTNMTTQDVELVLTSLLEIIMVSISKKEVVRLIGFGSFRFYERRMASHLGQPLESGISIKTVKFYPGKFFREVLSSSH